MPIGKECSCLAQSKKKKKFNLYDFFHGKEGKGIISNPDAKRNLKYFFPLYWRKISSILLTNLYLVIGNFPILFFLLGYSGLLNRESTAPTTAMFPFLYGVKLHEVEHPLFATLWSIFGVQGTVSIPTTFTYICYGLAFLLLFTFGPVNAATARFFRSMVKEEPIFYRYDFCATVKKNWKQSLIIGIIDLLAIFALLYGYLFYSLNAGASFFFNVSFYLFWVIIILYFFMRFYLYLILITFRLSIKKIFKNALIFAIVGLKRNVLALVGILAVLAINYFLLMVYYPIGLLLPFILTVATCAFIANYAAYPKIKELMIDPILQKQATAPQETDNVNE